MTPEELDAILIQTLEDRKLSRAEQKALREVVTKIERDDRLLQLYRQRAFEIARSSIFGRDSLEVVDWLEDVVKAFQAEPKKHESGRAESWFSPGDDCPRRVAQLFQAARATADVCVFTITDDRVSDAILAAHRRGVKVRIASDDEKSLDTGSDVDRLGAAGIPVRIDRSLAHMHHKFAIFDRDVLVTGSYNWTRSAADYNAENLVVVDDARLLGSFQAEFEKLWAAFA